MKARYLAILLLLTLTALNVHAQLRNLDIDVARNYRIMTGNWGFDPGPAGASISCSTWFPFLGYKVSPGLEAGTNSIANYTGATIGFYKSANSTNKKMELKTGIGTLQGIALFRPSPLYMYALTTQASISRITKKNNAAYLIIELRYTSSPGYSEFSYNDSFLSLRLGLGYSLRKK